MSVRKKSSKEIGKSDQRKRERNKANVYAKKVARN